MSASRPELIIDLAAIRHNIQLLKAHVAPAALLMVVKADAYGHGMTQCAQAARQAGVDWLGVATLAEALTLREAGDQGRILAWLDWPEVDYAPGIAAGIDLTAYSIAELERMVGASTDPGGEPGPARVQLKVDTGLSRGGCSLADWPDLVAHAAKLEAAGKLAVTGIWSHLAASDEPDHPANRAQQARFEHSVAQARAAGLNPEVVHLANSAAAILAPSCRYDLVRVGLASYGLDPAPGVSPEVGLRPAMTAQVPLALTKDLLAGEGVSYGHQWQAVEDTVVGLVPVGYGDGVPRHASNRAEVAIAGRRYPVRGRICMDQFVIDLGARTVPDQAADGAVVPAPQPGQLVTLFGPGVENQPTATDWAVACDTINYEIVTRIGGRFHRRWINESES